MRRVVLLFLAAGALSAQVSKTPRASRTATTCGPLADQIFKCAKFSFTYKVPFGWVDRTDQMQGESETGQQAPDKPAANTKSETLLAVFQRPPEATGETVNSAVVVAVESLANYPGLKAPEDYFGPLTEVAEQQGFKVENAPYSFTQGVKELVRGDFSKPRGKLEMRQSSLVMIQKGYVVSFTFIGGSEDEVDDLIGGLSFGGGVPSRSSRK